MTRTERLLELIQILRRHRAAISGQALAEELGMSQRTVYRDIATLKAQGAPIEGEAGVGFVLKPGFTLPPLMFSVEELEALLLGARWVDAAADRKLAWAARNAMAKIGSVLPRDVKREFETSNLWIAERLQPANDVVLQTLRGAYRRFRIDRIAHCHGDQSPYPRPRDELLAEWQKESHIYPKPIEF